MTKTNLWGDEPIPGYELDTEWNQTYAAQGDQQFKNTRTWVCQVDLPGSKSNGLVLLREIWHSAVGQMPERWLYELEFQFDTYGAFVTTLVQSFTAERIRFYTSIAPNWLESIYAISPTLPPFKNIPVGAEAEA